MIFGSRAKSGGTPVITPHKTGRIETRFFKLNSKQIDRDSKLAPFQSPKNRPKKKKKEWPESIVSIDDAESTVEVD